MAATYSLVDSTWRPRPLTRFLQAWASNTSPRMVPPVTGNQGGGSLRGHFIAEGSLRGVSLGFRARPFRTGAIDVTLGTCANVVDYLIGFQLLRALLENGGGTINGPGGSELSAQAITKSEAEAEGMASLREGVRGLQMELGERGRTWGALRYPRFDLFVVPGELPAQESEELKLAEQVESRLIQRMARYHAAEDLEIMEAGDGTMIAMWRFGDALVNRTPYVAVMRDLSEGAFVLAWNEIVALMGSRIEIASTEGRRYFFHALRAGSKQDDAVLQRMVRSGISLETFLSAHLMVGV